MGVSPSDRLRARLNYLHRTKEWSWRRIAASGEFSDVPAGTLCAIAGGWEPKGEVLRAKLGLPPMAPSKKECKICGAKFIPNVPRRSKCYICSPLGRYAKQGG